MIFLSAQPDDYYFLWQLELQLYNIHQLGFPAKQIHVLIGYDQKRGLNKEYKELVTKNKYALFYAYPDLRKRKGYLSSIRPHIIKQHFLEFEELSSTTIFYHDSDVLFNSIPDFKSMKKDNTWYASDTRSYTDSHYIRRMGGKILFLEMCNSIGIDPERIVANDGSAGGAQWVLKNVTFDFWNKMEADCENLYSILLQHNYIEGEKHYLKTGNPISHYHGIKSWYADMWAMLWNAWLFGYKVKIHPNLDFSWPYENIEKWQEKNILHYSGKIDKENEKLFCKGRYIHYPPYYDHFDSIDKSTCSYPIVTLIKDYLKENRDNRIDLQDITFLIQVRIDSEDRMENLSFVTKYLDKYFNTKIIVLEADIFPKVDLRKLPETVSYIFYKDYDKLLHRTHYTNIMVKMANTSIVCLYDSDVVIPISQVCLAVKKITANRNDCVSPYDGSLIGIDSLFKAMFGKLLDPELFLHNQGKFSVVTHRAWGGAVFLNKNSFIKAGMENENINSWGPEDIERRKRMEILGLCIKRIEGSLFHLPHPRNINSGYINTNTRVRLMKEYIKICFMKKEELKKYISTWQWVNNIKIENSIL